MNAANVRVLRDAGRKKKSGNGKKNKKNKKSVNVKSKKNKNKSAKRNKKNKSAKGNKKNKSAKGKKKNKSAKGNKKNKSAKGNKKNKSAKRNNKNKNKSTSSKNSQANPKTGKIAKQPIINCEFTPFELLVEVAKKYRTAQSQLKKALRINRFYSTATKKKDKASTTFSNTTREIIKSDIF